MANAKQDIAARHNIHPNSLEEVHISTFSLIGIGNRLMDYTPRNRKLDKNSDE